MDLSFLILIGVMLVVMLLMSTVTKRATNKRRIEQEKQYKEQLVPGAWVCTTSGFYGRFVELDGDVLILETPAGDETYWMKQAIRSIGDLPFAQEEDSDEDSRPAELSTKDDEDVHEAPEKDGTDDADGDVSSDED